MASAYLVDFEKIFSLAGKVVVITGGSRGLGLAAAAGIMQSGASKIYVSSRSVENCEVACAELNAIANKAPEAEAIPVPANTATIEGIRHLADTVSQTTGHVDILLANAGMSHPAPFESYPEDKFSDVLDLNLKSVFYTVQMFAPLLEKRATVEDTSRIIVTSSVSGVGLTTLGQTGNFAYAAAKAGAIHLVRQLAVHLGSRHILTNSISPGFFPTDMAAPIIERQGGEEALAKTYPNKRLGRAEDFAATVVYLSSRAGGHVNGNNIVLDGGGVIGRIRT